MLSSNRFISIRVKIISGFTGIVILSGILFISILYFYVRHEDRRSLEDFAKRLVSIAALQVDGDEHAVLSGPDDQEKTEYKKIYQALWNIHQAGQGINYPYTMKLNGEGDVIFIVDPTDDEPAALGEVYTDIPELLKENFASMSQPMITEDFYTDKWGTWLSAYAPIYRSDGQLEGVIGIDIPAGQALAQERQLLWVCLIALSLVIMVAVGGAVLLSRQITDPIKSITDISKQIANVDLPKLTGVAYAIAAGDLTQSVEIQASPIRVWRNDELGEIATAQNQVISSLRETQSAFSEMEAKIQTNIRKIHENIVLLNGASEQLTSASQQAAGGISQVAVNIQDIARGAAEQSESVMQTTSSMQQTDRVIEEIARGSKDQAVALDNTLKITHKISDTSRQMTATIQAAALETKTAADAASVGVTTVHETANGIEKISSKVSISDQKMRELGAHSERIGAIVEAIEDISSQTNLLALNAAIEAARAGEHGKGFAVVADEVRKLAERASSSTKEIGDLVKNIQLAVTEALAAMEESACEVAKGVKQANEAGSVLAAIQASVISVQQQAQVVGNAAGQMNAFSAELVSAMNSVSAVAEENMAATEEMSSSSDQITRVVESIARVSQENYTSVEEVSASIEKMNAQVEEISVSAQSLTEMAKSLSQVTAQFTLSQE